MERDTSAVTLRVMLVCLIVAYGITMQMHWYPLDLSTDATNYQQISDEVMSGPDLKFVAQKLCWILGNFAGALGIALMLIRIRFGLAMLLMCPAFLLGATIYGAPEVAFPGLEHTRETLLWCVTAAIWGSVVTYARLRSEHLFPKPAQLAA